MNTKGERKNLYFILTSVLICGLILSSFSHDANGAICGYVTTGSPVTTTSGGNTILKYTSSGSFQITCGSDTVTELIVGAGGGGAVGGAGGGSGAVISTSDVLVVQNYTLTVGLGGTGSNNIGNPCSGGADCRGQSGSSSIFNGHTATGGGGAGFGVLGVSGFSFGRNGDSAGGGSACSAAGCGGTFHAAPQGNNGFHDGGFFTSSGYDGGGGDSTGSGAGAGGGGANHFGGSGSGAGAGTGGVGGAGIANSITGSSITYAGGGGGAVYAASSGGTGGLGGSGGGGKGGNGAATCAAGGDGTSGTDNLGAGGGGAMFGSTASTECTAGNGGKGVVILSFPSVTPPAPTLTKANTISTTQIQPFWTSSSGATWYLVKRESPTGNGFSQVANVTTLNYNNTGLTAGTQYNFEIFAGNSSATSPPSNQVANYTSQSPPTTLVITQTSNSSLRISWTNPSGNNTQSFKIERESPSGGGFSTIVANTGNNTNHYDNSGLSGNTQYNYKISTLYGSIPSVSSASTVKSGYTLPTSPTNLQVTRSIATAIRTTWTPPTDNGTVTGYKIEFSTNGGSSWSVASANTGNSTAHYDHVGLNAALGYTYRISTYKNYGGISIPSANSPTSYWQNVAFTTFENDGTTVLTGNAIQSNSTSLNNIFPIVNGIATITGVSGKQNYTLQDAVTNLMVLKSYNNNATLAMPTTLNANVFGVDCPQSAAGVDLKLEINETNGHRISNITPITCSVTDLVTWNATFTGDGKSTASYNSVIKAIISSTYYQSNAQSFLANSTSIGTSYNTTTTILSSSPYTVGQGTKSYLVKYSLQLTYTAPPAPPTGGGGSGAPAMSQNATSPILGLSVTGYTFQANIGQIENGTMTVQWSTDANIVISSFDAKSYSSWIAFPKTPYTLTFKKNPTSVTIPIVLHVPSQGCDVLRGITINCADNKLYVIPVTITAKLGDTQFSSVANITVNLLNPQSYGLITALGIFIVAIAAFIIRATGAGKRLRGSSRREGNFLKKFKKEYG